MNDLNENEELIDFGIASEETRGAVFGFTWDGGNGRRWP